MEQSIYVTERLTILHSAMLPVVLTNYNNGQSRTWKISASERKKIERILLANGHQRKVPFGEPVVVRITRVLGYKQGLWDSDSGLRGNAKQLVDSLVACGWFIDDSAKYITETRFGQFVPKVREELGTTIVEVLRVEQIQGAINDTTTEI
jgi:hypothetical protein